MLHSDIMSVFVICYVVLRRTDFGNLSQIIMQKCIQPNILLLVTSSDVFWPTNQFNLINQKILTYWCLLLVVRNTNHYLSTSFCPLVTTWASQKVCTVFERASYASSLPSHSLNFLFSKTTYHSVCAHTSGVSWSYQTECCYFKWMPTRWYEWHPTERIIRLVLCS